jgi:hypothetical protein
MDLKPQRFRNKGKATHPGGLKCGKDFVDFLVDR